AAQVEKIIEVRGCPVGDDWKNAQIVAVIENLRKLVGERHVAAGQEAACDPDRPLVLARPQLGVWTALFERFRNGLGLNLRREGWTERAHPQTGTDECAGSPQCHPYFFLDVHLIPLLTLHPDARITPFTLAGIVLPERSVNCVMRLGSIF